MYKISIIIPVFNIKQDLLKKCINSLLIQTLDGIEIIFVDDASTLEETTKTLQKYKSVKNIQIITHTKNKKQDAARNTGIRHSNGEYIGFLDADDYIHKDMYKLLYEKALKENADCADCNLLHVDIEGKTIKEEISCNLVDKQSLIMQSGRLVTKIFKKELITKNDIYFPENMHFEDNAISSLHVLYANKVAKVDKSLYYYVRHNDSTISKSSLHIKDKIKAGQLFYLNMLERGFLERYKDEILLKFFKLYFKSTYRLIMKYETDYFQTLTALLTDLKKKNVDIYSPKIQKNLNFKEQVEIFLLDKTPLFFKLYVNIKYKRLW